MDLRHAIEQSCNVYFYNVGDRLGIDRIYKYAAMFGLVGKTGIDLPGEVESLVPSTSGSSARSKRSGTRAKPSRWPSDRAPCR
jgi:penicillin-binding protein 2